jgi:hypothetical protein
MVFTILCWFAAQGIAAPATKTRVRTSGKQTTHSVTNLAVQVQVVAAPDPKVPLEFALMQNYPNPFNASTRIGYTLPKRVHARLDIFNVLGKRVDTLVDEEQDAGDYSYNWSRQDLASGVFFFRLQAGSYSLTRVMQLVR